MSVQSSSGSYLLCSIVILFVGSLSFENDIAREAIFDGESEFGLIEAVLLGSEIDLDCLWQVLSFVLILWHWWSEETFWNFSEWQGFSF